VASGWLWGVETLWQDTLEYDVCLTWIAARAGNLPCLRYLVDLGVPVDITTFRDAAEGGHLHVLHYLRTVACPVNGEAYVAAREKGHTHVVDYLTHTYAYEAFVGATAAGPLSTVVALHEAGHDWTWFPACANAAYGGDLEILQYLHEHGCLWDTHTTENAAEGGHLACLQYAVEHGCPIDRDLLCRRLSSRHSSDNACLPYIESL